MNKGIVFTPSDSVMERTVSLRSRDSEIILESGGLAFRTAWVVYNGDMRVELIGFKTAGRVRDVRPENIDFLARVTVGEKELLRISPEAMSAENLGRLCELVRAILEPTLTTPNDQRAA